MGAGADGDALSADPSSNSGRSSFTAVLVTRYLFGAVKPITDTSWEDVGSGPTPRSRRCPHWKERAGWR